MRKVNLQLLSELSEPINHNIFRELYECLKFDKLIRLEIPFVDIPRVAKVAKKAGLSFSVSNVSYEVLIDKNLDYWGSSLVPCQNDNRKAIKLVYLHSDKTLCDLAKEFDSNNDERNLGQLLNYPVCCINSYLSWQGKDEDIDPVSIVISQYKFSGQVEIFNFPNPFSRYFGLGLFSHFPCSLSCAETKKTARSNLNNLLVDFPLVADTMIKAENALVVFDVKKGICIWRKFNSFENRIQLDKDSFLGQGELGIIFQTVSEIEIVGTALHLKSSFSGFDCLEAKNYFIGIFSLI